MSTPALARLLSTSLGCLTRVLLSLQTAPLSPQEKFLLDEAVLHHGYDWLQLAAYVPRADASLLPKLYREACGLKSKTWKAR
jgi:hypothetical protein